MKIVIPKRYVSILPTDILIFLAGPVLGGGDWQREFIEEFIKLTSGNSAFSDSFCKRAMSQIKFIVPCRWGADHPLAKHFSFVYECIEDSDIYKYLDDSNSPTVLSQTCWEFYYLDLIARSERGLIVFGLFPESETTPRTDGLPYAGDTRGEVARWTERAKPGNVLVGAHPEFLGIKTIMRNFELSLGDEWVDACVRSVFTPAELARWTLEVVEMNHKY